MSPLFLGYDAAGRKIRLSPEEQKSHMHILGSSGSGKSKFLEWLIRGDLRNGQGFCLIDPHGTLYEAVVSYAAHHVLNQRVILLNLSKPDSVVGFNPFRKTPGADLEVQVGQRIDATMHAWGARNTDETPTLARTLRLVYTVLIEQGLPFAQARHLINFEQKGFRADIIERLESPLIKQEWQELLQLTRREWREETLSAKNRLFRLLTSKTLSHVLGAPGGLNLKEIIDEGAILLVNLRRSDHLSKENARVFGALLVNEFFEVAFRREKDAFGRDPKPYNLYLDEFQNFVSFDIADMLDQVRKFGLYFRLAHQRFGQIDENVLEAALSHCHIKAVFGGLTVPNARRMAEELFIGKLDPKKIKVAIYQTKFWPKYQRDTVYTVSTGHAQHQAAGHQSGSGTIWHNSSGQSFQPQDWFGGTEFVGTTMGTTDSSGQSHTEGETASSSESEADIPIFFPVPISELSSVQFYSPEEQLIELTAALKRQYQRHCFIEIHRKEAQPLLVPFVENYYTPPTNERWYIAKVLAKAGALPRETVEHYLAERDAELFATFGITHTPHAPPRANDSDLPEDFYE